MGLRQDLVQASMKFSVLLFALGFAAGNVIEYNYYSELSTAAEKMTHLSFAVSTFSDFVGKGFKVDFAPGPGGLAYEWHDFLYSELSTSLSMDSVYEAAFGHCKPFEGYEATFINRPFAGLYSGNFWCMHLA